MSENITITDGVREPWELPGTDYEKPKDIILANLAMGQLAFVGSQFGKYINAQSMVTAELAEAVEKVKARSAEVASLFNDWQTINLRLNLTMPATGPYPIQPWNYTGILGNPVSAMDNLMIANNLITETGIANRFIPPLSPDPLTENSPRSYTIKFADGSTTTGFSPRIYFEDDPSAISDLQLYYKKDSDTTYDLSKVFVKFKGNEYEASNLKAVWVPSSAAEIEYFNNQLSLVSPAQNSRLLRDTTQIVPVPSESNSSTEDGEEILQQPVITMEVPITKPDFFQFKLEGGGYFYYEKMLGQVPAYDKNTIANNVGSVVQMEDKSYCYVVKSNVDPERPYVLIKATPEPCIKNPTDLQKSDILSKYSDKIVRITQRSTEQTTYVTMLVQRYNYFFEAATNILKAFTNLWSSLSSNI